MLGVMNAVYGGLSNLSNVASGGSGGIGHTFYPNMAGQQAQLQECRGNKIASYMGYPLEHDYQTNTYKIKVGSKIISVEDTAFQSSKYLDKVIQDELDRQKVKQETKVENGTIPDISLTRVFKWAIVLVVAMALGNRVWKLFGDKITAQVHKAIGEV